MSEKRRKLIKKYAKKLRVPFEAAEEILQIADYMRDLDRIAGENDQIPDPIKVVHISVRQFADHFIHELLEEHN